MITFLNNIPSGRIVFTAIQDEGSRAIYQNTAAYAAL